MGRAGIANVRRMTVLLGACLAAAVAVPAASLADPTIDTEPNDNVFEMNGPITADGVVGTLSSAQDVDEYLVQMRPVRSVMLVFSVINAGTPQCVLGPPAGRVVYQLANAVAEPLVGGVIDVGGGETTQIKPFMTPGELDDPSQPLRLTFSAQGDPTAGCSYRFTVTDSGGYKTTAIDPTPLAPVPAVTVSEPDDLPAQALGPVVGDTYYFGTIDSPTDVDRLSAWLLQGQPVTLELSAIGADVQASVEDPLKNVLLAPLMVKPEQIRTGTIVATPAENEIAIQGQMGAHWRLRLLPASSVLASAPGGKVPGPPPKKFKTGATIHRSGTGALVRYTGKLTSPGLGCKSSRLVILRHAGSGVKRFSQTRSEPDGSFTLTRQTRTGGTVYAAVAEENLGRRFCRFGRSHRVGA